MLKILQARFQQYINQELPDVQAGFRKGRGTRNEIVNICWIVKKARELHKNIYFCFIDCADHNKGWKVLKEVGIPDHLTFFQRNLHAEETTVRTRLGKQTGFKFGKEYIKAVYFHSAYLTYAEYIMQNARLDEAQAGIKIFERNINNLIYADDTTPPLWRKMKN